MSSNGLRENDQTTTATNTRSDSQTTTNNQTNVSSSLSLPTSTTEESSSSSAQQNLFKLGSVCSRIKRFFFDIAVFNIMLFIRVYDLLTLPAYYLIQQPWLRWERAHRVRTVRKNLADPQSAYYRIGQHQMYHMSDVHTIPQAQKRALEQNGPTPRALAYREVLQVKQEYSETEKKMIHKYVLTEYKWLTHAEVDEQIGKLETAFRAVGVKEYSRVLIYCDTRIEWFLSAHAVLRIGAAIATMYSTLGKEGLRYGIEETEAQVIVTSESLLERFPTPLNPRVRIVIYLPLLATDSTSLPESLAKVAAQNPKTDFISYRQFLAKGESFVERKPKTNQMTVTEEHPAVILYTSGSTGKPKGVILTHKNFLTAVKATLTILTQKLMNERDHHCWYGFLPLAHILEFIAEMSVLSLGIRIGYGSPFTMSDFSTGIIKGQPGDLTLLQPTIIPGVPLVLERIRKVIMEKLQHRSEFFTLLIQALVEYKNFWIDQGYDTPIYDRLVSERFRKHFGKQVEIMIIGGAALSTVTQRLMRALFNVKILIGYGSTETCGANIIMDLDDISIGRTGAPLFGIKLRFVDWTEGGYTSLDKPYPRGELHVGGDAVSKGYFMQDDLTKEAFYQENGVQWFCTGDIAEVNEFGLFRIVDRKKDLVKLENGEFVSLGKIESELRNCILIDNVCIVGDSKAEYVVALIMPAWNEMKKLMTQYMVQKTGKKHLFDDGQQSQSISADTVECLRTDPDFVSLVTKRIEEFCKASTKLMPKEVPQRVYLCKEEWTPNNDLMTAAMKIKRINLVRFYAKPIAKMFGLPPSKNNLLG